MSVEIVRLTAKDYEETVDFWNLIFSQAHCPHDFEDLLPKIVRPDEEKLSCNLACRRDGRIRAVIGLYPMQMNVLGKTLKVGGVGNVSTHYHERGSGLMRLLMTETMHEIERKDIDLSVLGGERQRYGRYGYEPAGNICHFHFTAKNFKEEFGAPEEMEFAPVRPEDKETMDFIRTLYESRPAYMLRGDDKEFELTLRSWSARAYIAKKDGKPIGYLAAKASNACGLNEAMAVDSTMLVKMLHAWLASRNCSELTLGLPVWEQEAIRALSAFCSGLQVQPVEQFFIRSWDKVTDAFFALRAHIGRVMDGEVVLGIEGWGNILLKAENGKTSCTRTERPADLTAPASAMTRMLFGPFAPSHACALPEEKAALLESWLPLPLSALHQDMV